MALRLSTVLFHLVVFAAGMLTFSPNEASNLSLKMVEVWSRLVTFEAFATARLICLENDMHR
jgi:hypothetical protein